MYERFTDRARRVLGHASGFCRRNGFAEMSPGILFFGLVDVDEVDAPLHSPIHSVLEAGGLLRSDLVRQAILQNRTPSKRKAGSLLAADAELQRVYGHLRTSDHIGVEHLLLALLTEPLSNDMSDLLSLLEVDPQLMRAELTKQMERNASQRDTITS